MQTVTLTTPLAAISGICWIIVYIEAIRIGFRERTVAMPFWALALNLSWELLHTFYSFRIEGASLQAVINTLWALFDFVILYTWFRFGKRQFPNLFGTSSMLPWSLLVIVVSLALQYSFMMEFGMYKGRAYAAFLQNLLMSVLFIDMLVRRGSSEGQSISIAVNKWIGTLAPTIVFGVIGGYGLPEPNRLLLVTGGLCSMFDLLYLFMLAKVMAKEKKERLEQPLTEPAA